jgi:hypothetical protein
MNCSRYFAVLPILLVVLLGCSGRATRKTASVGHGGANSDGGASPIGGTDDGGAGAAGATNVNSFSCEVSVSRNDYDSGFEVCDGSNLRVHRSHATSCQSQLPRADIDSPSGSDQCTSDDQCVDLPNGFCDPGGGPDGIARICQYGCLVDNDCAAGSICLCGAYIGYCTPAECVTDDDCPAGLLCAAYWTQCHQHVGFACQSTSDICFDDQSCGTGRCERDADGIRRCTTAQCGGI